MIDVLVDLSLFLNLNQNLVCVVYVLYKLEIAFVNVVIHQMMIEGKLLDSIKLFFGISDPQFY